MVEDAWYNGMTVSDLATRYGISEAKARGMLCDGMAELRMKFAAGTK
jgi:DNA-binding transcriptional regulator LsrR (DeoR family)